MLVRESPRAKGTTIADTVSSRRKDDLTITVSPDKAQPNWPPKSPYEALLSSPSGRKKWQERSERAGDRTPSPSPITRAKLSARGLQALSAAGADEDETMNEDEDEETLQLQLQAIEARLKLKKLQAKSKTKTVEERATSPEKRARADSDSSAPRKRVRMENNVQVPVSPSRDRVLPPQDKSPARVLLGIDKGWRAQDVSLKRAKAAGLAAPSSTTTSRTRNEQSAEPKTKSFSERLADSRSTALEREAKEERVQQARGRGFGIEPKTSQHERLNRALDSSETIRPATKSNVQTADAPSVASNVPAQRALAADTTDQSTIEPFSSLRLSRRNIEHVDLTRALSDKELYSLPRLLKEIRAPHYEPPDCESDYVVFGIIASKSSPYTTAPSSRKTTKPADTTGSDEVPSNKYMVLKLTDLDWEIDLFLFGTAFTKWWKLTPGTVVGVLNPSILPPKPGTSGNRSAQDTGRFSLKLSSSDDEVLEIGTSKDLSFCTSLKKDGKKCEAWINGRKTQFCDFHVNLAMEKTRAGRMEVNGMHRHSTFNNHSSTNRGGRGGRGGFGSRAGPPAAANSSSSSTTSRDDGSRFDRETGEMYYMTSAPGNSSAAQIMDAEEALGRPEALRKRLAEKERERELMSKLGRIGNGIGAEYLRAGTAAHDAAAAALDPGATRVRGPDELPEKLDAEALGLVGRKEDVRLSPVKRKRAFPASASYSSTSSVVPRSSGKGRNDAVGWGGAFRRGLPGQSQSKRASSPEKGQLKITDSNSQSGSGGGGGIVKASGILNREARETSPKKKARFALESGIRVPGRESFGDIKGPRTHGDDDDELDII